MLTPALALRLVTAGHWPWPSDGDITAFLPPRDWRPWGSHLTPSHGMGAGLWSQTPFLRIQTGRRPCRTPSPGAADR